MVNYWDIVNRIIYEADILLLIIDARQPDDTLNLEIKRKITSLGKQLLYVLNKCDLVSEERLNDALARLKPSVYVSCTKHYGVTKLRQAIFRYGMPVAKQAGRKELHVGVLGYPNVGKSSVINLLKGKGAAGTSPNSGFTRGHQLIRLNNRILLMDTPGVLPREDKGEIVRARIGAKNPSDVKDPDLAAMDLIEHLEGAIEQHYTVKAGETSEETLEKIAKRLNFLLKGGEPDINRTARKIIQDWQHGKIKRE